MSHTDLLIVLIIDAGLNHKKIALGAKMIAEPLEALSAQEQVIVDGKNVLHGIATDRVLRILVAARELKRV